MIGYVQRGVGYLFIFVGTNRTMLSVTSVEQHHQKEAKKFSKKITFFLCVSFTSLIRENVKDYELWLLVCEIYALDKRFSHLSQISSPNFNCILRDEPKSAL